jgi:hypothetical protein
MRTFTGSNGNFGTSLRFLKLEMAILLITRKPFRNRKAKISCRQKGITFSIISQIHATNILSLNSRNMSEGFPSAFEAANLPGCNLGPVWGPTEAKSTTRPSIEVALFGLDLPFHSTTPDGLKAISWLALYFSLG